MSLAASLKTLARQAFPLESAGVDVNDTWLWSGTDWSQLAPQQSPPRRESMGMAFDALHQQTVVFGGQDGLTLLNDTWVLQTP